MYLRLRGNQIKFNELCPHHIDFYPLFLNIKDRDKTIDDSFAREENLFHLWRINL